MRWPSGYICKSVRGYGEAIFCRNILSLTRYPYASHFLLFRYRTHLIVWWFHNLGVEACFRNWNLIFRALNTIVLNSVIFRSCAHRTFPTYTYFSYTRNGHLTIVSFFCDFRLEIEIDIVIFIWAQILLIVNSWRHRYAKKISSLKIEIRLFFLFLFSWYIDWSTKMRRKQ